MTCQDCVHYGMCNALEKNGIGKISPQFCGYFKDKSKFIELPCKVGQDVWFYASTMKELCKAKIIKIEINYFTPDNPFWLAFEYYSNIIGRHEIFSRSDLLFGKTVFLTKEEAEQALKEREGK